MSMLGISMPDSLKEKLRNEAFDAHMTLSQYIRERLQIPQPALGRPLSNAVGQWRPGHPDDDPRARPYTTDEIGNIEIWNDRLKTFLAAHPEAPRAMHYDYDLRKAIVDPDPDPSDPLGLGIKWNFQKDKRRKK